ncbi:MAG: GNAT family N-acetyltransferase [Alphaproteobacteria bacterium]|nr:GNAT family N-acetyltransferase [Alphaproteobacteria bacterium]
MADMLSATITTLAMRERPQRRPPPPPQARLMLLRAEAPPPSFYRYLYSTIGEAWFWWERREWSDARIAVHLAEPNIELSVLYCRGAPAGMAELDLSALAKEGCIVLERFGLLPEFLGQGFGRALLDWMVESAWRRDPLRLEAKVCSLDHPRGLPLLQKLGFVAVEQTTVSFPDPRARGLISASMPLPNVTPAAEPLPAEAAPATQGSNVTPLPRRPQPN